MPDNEARSPTFITSLDVPGLVISFTREKNPKDGRGNKILDPIVVMAIRHNDVEVSVNVSEGLAEMIYSSINDQFRDR